MNRSERIRFLLGRAKDSLAARIQNPDLDESQVQYCITGNQTRAFEYLVHVALIQWRHRLASPAPVLARAVRVAHGLAARLEAFHPGSNDRAYFLLPVASYANYLLFSTWEPALTNPLPSSKDRKAAELWGDQTYLDLGVLSELRGSGLPSGWKELAAKVQSQKREKLWGETSWVYVELIRAGRAKDGAAVKTLARQAAELFVKRDKYSFFSGGYEGGGGESKDVVDFRLAAILKSLGRHAEGLDGDETVGPHLWRWGTLPKKNLGVGEKARATLMHSAVKSLQKQARQKVESRDKWVFANFRRNTRYHREECPDFQKIPRPSQLKMEPAVAKRDGYKPCPKCSPP